MAAGAPKSNAPRPAAAPAQPAPPLPISPTAAGARLPLAWFALAFFWLALGAGLLVWHASGLTLHHMHPITVGLTHAWVLGFLLSATFGAVYQLLPVVLGEPLALPRAGWVHFGLHGIAVAMMVPAFLAGRYDWAAFGGGLAVAGVLLFVGAVWLTVARLPRRDPVAWAFVLASGWLLLAVLVGLLLAINRRWGWLTADPLALLRMHAHLGVVGFFLTLLQGVTFRLVPMFTLAEVRNWRRVGEGIAGTQIGLLGLAPALAFHWPTAQVAFAVVLVAAAAWSALALRGSLATRRKRTLEPALHGFLTGAGLFGAAIVFGLILAVWPGDADGWTTRGALAYGLVALLGGLVTMIGGMLGKIVPFLVWMHTYGPRVGRQAVPLAAQLPRPALERAWLGLHVTGVTLLFIGVIGAQAPWLIAGAWLVLAGVAAFLANQGVVGAHLWHPQSGAVLTSPPLDAQRKFV